MDAAVSIVADGIQRNLRASRLLNMERMDTTVGPIAVEVVEPLKTLRIRVAQNAHGIAADLTFHARALAVEEPRFTYRIGPRTLLDYTRLTQNGDYDGFLEFDGRRIALERGAVLGTRDRSWGVRPIGLGDPQGVAPPRLPQFYWLWAPLNFADRFLLYHNNADADGVAWNTAAVVGELGDAKPMHMRDCRSAVVYKKGTRHAATTVIEAGAWRAELTTRFQFYMSGIGYGHPEWGHGMYRGENALGYDTLELAAVDENDMRYQHIQAFVTAHLSGPGVERDGAGHPGAACHRPLRPARADRHLRSRPMKEALGRYLAEKLGAPDLTVHDLARIPGGASRETYRFRARYGGMERKLILRRDPPASLIETDRTTEYRAYEAFHRLGLPVPEPIAIEREGSVLERPFFVMTEIEDASVGSILAPDPYGSHRETIGRQFWTILGRIAGADPEALGLSDFDGATSPDACWRHETARWEKVIDEDEDEPQPIARGALRWLKRHPPPPAQKIAVVHGDYRSGNFLYGAEGDLRAVLDWEMAHLGDPLEGSRLGARPALGASRSLAPGRDAAARRSHPPLGRGERSCGRSRRAVVVGDLREPQGLCDMDLGGARIRDAA